MDSPIQLNFFKKLELYQELKSRDKRLGKDKAWSGEKEILRWTAVGHRHLDTPIDMARVQKDILIDKKYDNFPADAERPMENLISRGYASGKTSKLRFLKEGLLMGEVIDDIQNGKSWKYLSIYVLAWAAVISGAIIVIVSAAKLLFPLILLPVSRIAQWISAILWRLFMAFHIAYILDKLWPAFFAVIVTQLVTQKLIEMRKPKLEMIPEGCLPNTWGALDSSTSSPYHMWRINVQQNKIPRYLAWLIKSRKSALYCKADLTFYNSTDQALFTMHGRWANSPEISLISQPERQERMIYPEPINVAYHSPQQLDCIVQFDNENVAHGWNNEAYATNGRNPRYRLTAGIYKVAVDLSGENFQRIGARFKIKVAGSWNGTSLEPVGR